MKVASYALDGLVTDPGPFSGAPDGALVDAHNVVVERKGLIEPRGGLRCTVDATLKAAGAVIQHEVADSGLHARAAWAVTGGGAWSMRGNDAIAFTGPTSFTKGRLHSALAGGRLLFTSQDGVCEWPTAASGGTVTFRAGLMQPSQTVSILDPAASAGQWLGLNKSVAYRFTLVRFRSDGTEMESAPTAPLIVRNTAAAGGAGVILFGALASETPWDVNNTYDALQAGDMVRVYRSPVLNAATGTPSDVMRLRANLTITAGVVQTFTDALADSDWNGPELYTNARREGIGQARTRPAYARDVCAFNGMMLYAGYKTPHRVRVTCKAIGDISRNPQEALCSKSITVTTTAGSANLTGISAADVKYIAAGQWITLQTTRPGSADARFQVDTQIQSVNVGAGTAVMTKTALVSGAIGAIVWDWVGITDGATTYRQFAQEAAYAITTDLQWLQAHQATVMGGYSDLENRWNNAATRVKDVVLHCTGSDEINGAPEFRNVLMVFERASQSSTSFTVKSTKPNAFDRTVTYTTGIASTQDGGDARVALSVNNIPDAVPELNYVDVGDVGSAIYRIVPTRHTVFVFKADGVYQIFGDSPSAISVQLLDATVRPPNADIAANWITVRGDTVYAMTSRGPMAVSEMGVTPFGGAIMETLRETFRPDFERAGSFTSCSAGSAQGTPYALFSYEDASGSNVFAFNTETNAWTTWSARRNVSAFYNVFGGAQGVAMQHLSSFYYDRRSDMGVPITGSTWPLTGDSFSAATCTINTVTPNGTNRYTIVIAAGSEWTPTVGDVLIRSGVLGVVESVASATTFDVVSNGTPTTGSATWNEGYPVRLVWAARTLGTIASEKRNVSLGFGFALRALLLRLSGYFRSSYAPGGTQTVAQPAVTGAWDGSADALLAAPELMSLGIPRDVVLDWGLRVGFTMQQARSWFSLGAVIVDALDSGQNTGRHRV
jgi:hypothetical protein